MRELPMMKQVEDLSLEIVLEIMFHYITELIRRLRLFNAWGASMYTVMFACRVTLPAAWHCHLAQSGGLQEITG